MAVGLGVAPEQPANKMINNKISVLVFRFIWRLPQLENKLLPLNDLDYFFHQPVKDIHPLINLIMRGLFGGIPKSMRRHWRLDLRLRPNLSCERDIHHSLGRDDDILHP